MDNVLLIETFGYKNMPRHELWPDLYFIGLINDHLPLHDQSVLQRALRIEQKAPVTAVLAE